MICVDTNVVIAMINGRIPQVRDRVAEALAAGEPVIVPAIVAFELWQAVAKSVRCDADTRILGEFFAANLPICAFDAEDAREAGVIRAVLAEAGTPIGPYDVLIAAQARRRGARLVTVKVREFVRVPGLMVENWAASPRA